MLGAFAKRRTKTLWLSDSGGHPAIICQSLRFNLTSAAEGIIVELAGAKRLKMDMATTEKKLALGVLAWIVILGLTTRATVDDRRTPNPDSKSASVFACIPPPPAMTAWWTGDCSADDLVGGYTAILHGGATFGPGRVGQAFVLNGTAAFVEVPHTPALNLGTGDFTVDLWVKFDTTSGEQVLVEKYVEKFGPTRTGWTLTKLADNRLHFRGTGDERHKVTSAVLSIPTGTWVFFAARRSGDTFTLFMNGEAVATATFSANLDCISSLKFGHRGNPNDTPGSTDWRGFYLKGGIDEVELFVGRALSDAELFAIYSAGPAGKCKNSLPDLVVENLATDKKEYEPGEVGVATVTVRNQGGSCTGKDFAVTLYTDADGHVKCSTKGNSETIAGPLAPGGSVTFSVTFAAKSGPGPHELRVFADSDCEINENKESNNQATVHYRTVESSPPLHLELENSGTPTGGR